MKVIRNSQGLLDSNFYNFVGLSTNLKFVTLAQAAACDATQFSGIVLADTNPGGFVLILYEIAII